MPIPAAAVGPSRPAAIIHGIAENTRIAGPCGSRGTPGGGDTTPGGNLSPINKLLIGVINPRNMINPQRCSFIGLLNKRHFRRRNRFNRNKPNHNTHPNMPWGGSINASGESNVVMISMSLPIVGNEHVDIDYSISWFVTIQIGYEWDDHLKNIQ